MQAVGDSEGGVGFFIFPERSGNMCPERSGHMLPSQARRGHGKRRRTAAGETRKRYKARQKWRLEWAISADDARRDAATRRHPICDVPRQRIGTRL